MFKLMGKKIIKILRHLDNDNGSDGITKSVDLEESKGSVVVCLT